MIVQLTADSVPTVREGMNLTRLEVVADGPEAVAQGLGTLGRADADGEHVWLSICLLYTSRCV